MEKITIIDLLNMIANREEVPYKIKYNEKIFEYDYGVNDFRYEYKDNYGQDTLLFNDYMYNLTNYLNDVVEIVEIIEEDKKIEKIKTKIGYGHLVYLENESFSNGDMGFTNRENVIVDKINEIIDYINKEGK